jgi:acyl-coenzyme A thioesterase 13
MNKNLANLKNCIGKSSNDEGLGAVSRWIDGTLIYAEEGHLKITFKVLDTWLNPAKTLHGGMAATLIDDVMGMTVYSLGNEVFFSTVSLNLDFLSFALAGDEITVEAKVIRKGISVINIEGYIYKRNKLLVKATSNLVSSGKKVF